MKDRLFEIWFSLCVGAANPAFIPLMDQFTPYELFSMGDDAIQELPCDEKLKQTLRNKSLEESHRIQRYCYEHDVHLLFWLDEAYPKVLRLIKDPPLLLYYRGVLPDFNRELCIATVGTRTMSEYGKRMSYKIGYELATAGAVVVSGLALGVDAVAAAGAIASGGRTVAILGCGIDIVYPPVHATLMNEIIRHGAVMTEYPPAARPLGYHFPQRNRIISGLSQGTVVIEADNESGALITAKTAIAQGRDIYAVPGNVGDPNTSGTNDLILAGAGVVLKAQDILDNYAFLYRDSLKLTRLKALPPIEAPNEAVLERLAIFVRQPKRSTSKKRLPSPTSSANTPSTRSTKYERSEESSQKAADMPEKKTVIKPPAPPPSVPRKGDLSEQTLQSLSETQRKIFELIPLDHAVAVDYLAKAGYSMSEIMSSMTMLEIKGLVVSLPGGLFSRK